MGVQVRELTDRDFFAWLGLWEGYCEFYKTELTDTKALTVWSWLTDKAHELSGYVAQDGDELVGLAHVREYPRTLDADRALFLDDLFVVPDARGKGVGRALLDQVAALAKAKGMNEVSWVTAADNETAQQLYDQVAKRTDWVTYEAPVQ